MSPPDLEERGRSLEEEFFHKHNEKLRAQLRAKKAREMSVRELSEATGISDEAVLDRLVDLGISVDTLAAFSLVPLVQVAWADGRLERRERDAVLRAADERGIRRGSPAYGLLDSLLQFAPAPSLLDAWAQYVEALREAVDERQLTSLRDDTLERAREVAHSAGGFLGLGKITAEEERILARIEATFGS